MSAGFQFGYDLFFLPNHWNIKFAITIFKEAVSAVYLGEPRIFRACVGPVFVFRSVFIHQTNI